MSKSPREEKNAGETLEEANYNVYIGAILGLPGRILAFFASLVSASLPVAGFMIWWGRRKKRNRSPKNISKRRNFLNGKAVDHEGLGSNLEQKVK